ncbi:MAG: hypothetical protein NTV51_30765, partial [Verrucomicrobia bacterium]|nr:hypothetical protein [Verrucomicrobiota bacterium]
MRGFAPRAAAGVHAVVLHQGADLLLIQGDVEDEDLVDAAAEKLSHRRRGAGAGVGEIAAEPHVVRVGAGDLRA